MANVDQAKKKQEKPRKKVEERASRPVSQSKIILHSVQAQRIYERNYSIISAHLYSMLVMPRIYKRQDVAETASKEVMGKLQKITDDLRSEIERIEKIKTDNGIEDLSISYSNVKTIQAEVTTPQALTFLQLLVQLDHLIKGLDTLWMGGVIDDNQKSDGAYQWQRRLVKFTGQIRQLDAILKKGLKQTAEDPEEASKAHTEEKPEQKVAAPDSEPTAKEPPASKKVAVA